MITPEQAIDSTRHWLHRRGEPAGGELLTREFDLGYLVWRRPTDSSGMPDLLGSRRVIVDKVTGRVYPTGSLSQEIEAERYAVKHAATSRFPVDVLAVLETAGWWPGSRDQTKVTAEYEALAARIRSLAQRLPLLPAAVEALAEFMGLRFRQLDSGPGVQLWPHGQRSVVDSYVAFGDAIGVPVFPFGRSEDGPSDVVIDAAGRLYVLRPDGDFYLADNVVDALVGLVRGPDLRRMDVRPRGAAAIAADPVPRGQQAVEVSYHAVFPDGTTSAPATKTWFVDLPVSLSTAAVWEELVLRILYDANTNRQRVDPLDRSWFELDGCDLAVVDARRVLAWDGAFTEQSLSQYLPFLVAQAKASWEPAACLVLDERLEYGVLRAEEFVQLVIYRGLAAGKVDEASAGAFLERLFPGQAGALLARWPAALDELTVNRPTREFRKTPAQGPFEAGPVDPTDLNPGAVGPW